MQGVRESGSDCPPDQTGAHLGGANAVVDRWDRAGGSAASGHGRNPGADVAGDGRSLSNGGNRAAADPVTGRSPLERLSHPRPDRLAGSAAGASPPPGPGDLSTRRREYAGPSLVSCRARIEGTPTGRYT